MSQYLKIFNEFNKNDVKYVVLRNYDILKGSVDVSISKSSYNVAEKILLTNGFIKRPKRFSSIHQGFQKIGDEIIGLDIQIGGVSWNDFIYLNDEIFIERKKYNFFYVMSNEHQFCMYVIHSILGKRYFKEKYKIILYGLIEDVNVDKVKVILNKLFFFVGNILYLIRQKRLNELNVSLMFMQALFKNPKIIIHNFLIFPKWLYLEKLRLNPMICLIGPDGAGKTTMCQNLSKNLINFRDCEVVYLGRGKKNILPVKKIGNIYKSQESKRKIPSVFKKMLYSVAAPIYTLDLLFRYLKVIRKRLNKIIITDRYCSDILMMNNVPFFLRKILLSLFPKPDLTFFLYNTPEKLISRKKENSIQERERQLKLFTYLADEFDAERIKTNDIKKDSNFVFNRSIEFIVNKGY